MAWARPPSAGHASTLFDVSLGFNSRWRLRPETAPALNHPDATIPGATNVVAVTLIILGSCVTVPESGKVRTLTDIHVLFASP